MKTDKVEIKIIEYKVPDGCNIIIGKSHFIKTVEDIHEALVNSVPNIKFGVAFNESSGPCLVRHSGNDETLEKESAKLALEIGAGHEFVVLVREAYPINVLDRIRKIPEFVTFHCATANPIQILVAETKQGKAIIGVIDGLKTRDVEKEKDIKERKEFLRKIGYKL